jgi:GNAT superfamily N-acetyltransferase
MAVEEGRTTEWSQHLPYATCPYRHEAIPGVLDLVRGVLGGSPATQKTVDFWEWKHHRNHFGASTGFYAQDRDTQLTIGLRLFLRWSFRDPEGRRYQAVRAVDAATHPDYQRQGIFTALMQRGMEDLRQQGVALIYSTPNRQTSLAGHLKAGWQIVATWPLYVRVLRPVRMLRGLASGSRATRELADFGTYFGDGIVPWEALVGQYSTVLPHLIARWEEKRRMVGFRTVRDLAYLEWRYGSHPNVRYGFWAMEAGGELAGVAVLRPNTHFGLKEIILAEILLWEPNERLGRQLIKKLMRELKGDYVVAHFAQGTWEQEFLRATRFLRVPRQGILFTACALGLPDEVQVDAANWDLSLGDLEML